MQSRQQEWQESLRKQGLCVTCGKIAVDSTRTSDGRSRYCQEHKNKMANYFRIYMRTYRKKLLDVTS